MILKIYLLLLQKKRASAGWTLVELMIASSLTLVVTMAAGFGLISILRENKVANATGEMQYNLNRASEFISEELRTAAVIETSLEASDLSTFAGDFDATGKTPVLALKVPGVPQRIVYYVEDVADTDIWRGPAVIRRWGPGFTGSGTYDSTQSTPSAWNGDALVDMMVTDLPAGQRHCSNATATATEGTYTDNTDPTQEWYRLPRQDTDVKGFFVCVRQDKQLAQLHIHGTTLYTDSNGNEKGQLKYVTSKDPNSRFNSKANYEVMTQAFARSDKVGSQGQYFPEFYVDTANKQIVIKENGKAKISVLSLNIPCHSGSSSLPSSDVTTELTLDDGSLVGAAANGLTANLASSVSANDLLTLKVTAANSGGCLGTQVAVTVESNGIYSGESHAIYGSNDSKYLHLDSIITDATARNAVKSELNSKGLLDSDGNTLYLADNQILYFVELEFDANGDPSTPQSDALYDDAVILIELSN